MQAAEEKRRASEQRAKAQRRSNGRGGIGSGSAPGDEAADIGQFEKFNKGAVVGGPSKSYCCDVLNSTRIQP